MKKAIILLLSFIMTFSLFGCESEADKTAREAREAQENADRLNRLYEQQKDDYDRLSGLIDDYNNALGK